MKIIFNNAVRKFEAGATFDFDKLPLLKSFTIVGENGCGKSTIMQAIRGSFPSTTESLYEADNVDLVKKGGVVIEHDYDKAFFLDSIKDNGLDFNNAYDAAALVLNGGYGKNRVSHGESSLQYMYSFLKRIESAIVPNKTLIVLDEVDKGLSLSNQAKFKNFVTKLTVQYDCDVLVVSHNPFFIIQSIFCYDVASRDYVASRTYIKDITGFDICKEVV